MADLDTTQAKNQLNAPPQKPGRKFRARRVFGVAVSIILITIAALLLVHAALSVFMPHYYLAFGKYRLFPVVTDSMEPEIPRGHMIVTERPVSAGDIGEGTIIAFEVADKDGDGVSVLTRRVTKIENENGIIKYTAKGDNAAVVEDFQIEYGDVVGIYTGKHCAAIGYVFGFLQSESGIALVAFLLLILLSAWVMRCYIVGYERRKSRDNTALKKSARVLSDVNLRYDNVREITAVMDVLGMVTEEPKTRAERREIDRRLKEFIAAESIELPHAPETAAILDSLPAPDTPMTLAAALRTGATLRQAEDGQTLILTGMSGGKSILLTPIQTPDGIILCQQGVRIRSDIAPNIESVGATSMPQYPEFFEGQPLKKNVEYPELPEPSRKAFGAEMLSPHNKVVLPNAQEAEALLTSAAAPEALDAAKPEQHVAEVSNAQANAAPTADAEREETFDDGAYRAKLAYAQYREAAAALELSQTEELVTLLKDVVPLSPEEQEQIDHYRNANKATKPDKKPRAPQTPEQREARRRRAEQKKAEQEAFLNALSPADRELYLSEQRLAKSRAAAIRRLKRINADRKILNKLSTPDAE